MARREIIRAADQMVVVMARRMSQNAKVQVGVNTPLVETASLLAKRLNPPGPTVYIAAISGAYYEPACTSLFRSEWDAIAGGAGFPVETIIDLVSGWEGVDDEPVHPIQVDRFGNVNLSGIVDEDGEIGLMGPGPAGVDMLPYMLRGPSTLYTTRHTPRTLVESVDMMTGVGYLSGGASRLRAGLSAHGGFAELVTNLCVIRFTAGGPYVNSIYEWVDEEHVRRHTGFEMRFSDPLPHTEPPTDRELTLLSEIDPLNLRTLEFYPSTERRERAVDIWREEADRGTV